jgi:uncharacterized repeat protein (TIGR01451 family)
MTKHTRARGLLSAATVVIAATGLTLGTAAPASAAAAVAVSIQGIGATIQASGSTFTYQVNLACASTNSPTCNDAIVHIPLDSVPGMASWGYDVSGGPAGFIQGWQVVGDELVVTLSAAITAGTSQSIQVEVTPPNLETPDGTTWSLLPTVTSVDPDMTPTTAPSPATGTATASVPLTVGKSSDRTFYASGETIEYTLRVTCPASPPLGSVYADGITISDTLPAGLTFVSAVPAPTSTGSGNELTWVYADQDHVPAACGGSAPDAAADTITVTATVGTVGAGGDFASYENVPNTVTATASPVGPGADVTKTATRTVVMLGAGDPPLPGTRSLGKSSSAPLNRGPAGSPDRRATYPGRWLPNGIDPAATPSIFDAAPATYTISPRIQYDSFQYEITDKLPCLDDLSASGVYTASAGVCTNPAFHLLGIRIEYNGGSASPLPSGYAPQYRDVSGVLHDLVFEASSGSYAGWIVPAAALGSVAEIVIPRDASQQDRLNDNIRVYGYADPSVVDGQVLQNRADISWWVGSAAGAPAATAASNTADILILDAAQIGAQKTVTDDGPATSARIKAQLTGTLISPTDPTEPFVFADLLTAGTSLVTDPASITARISRPGASDVTVPNSALVVELIPDHEADRDLLRVTVPASAFPGSTGGTFTVALSELTIEKPSAPGVYENRLRVFYDDPDLLSTCAAGDFDPDDPESVRPSGAGPENCIATAQFRTVTSASGQFRLVKTVQGDYDTSPQTFPAVGHVKLTSGLADWALTWTNTGAPTLRGVVLYDVFPHVGDTGVSGAQASAARGSEFQPLLAGVGALPPDVTVAYSASADACRPEVFAGQGACVDDWTADPSTIGGLAAVMAIRITSTADYATGEGFTIGYQSSIPTVDRDLIAWNSVAAFAETTSGVDLLPTESPRVGITASDSLLAFGKTVDLAAARPGDTLTYTVTVRNVGTLPSDPTTLSDVLPDGVSFVSADGGGTYDSATRTVTWPVPALARDTDTVFHVVTRVGPIQDDGQVMNRATIVDPPGFSPSIPLNPCATGSGACALTAVPVTPALGLTGSDAALIAAAAAAGLLGLGTVLVLVTRSRRRRA